MTVRILVGDCRTTMPTLPEKSVQCCVTSPPYWGLRDYGTATWEGGDLGCDHANPKKGQPTWGPGSTGSSTLQGKPNNDNHEREGFKGGVCPKCGAVRVDSQLGLERVPDCLGWATKQPCGECYVCHTVAWAREVRRVLRDDGVMFLNLGDSYVTGTTADRQFGTLDFGQGTMKARQMPRNGTPPGLKPKDLVGIPWRVALALQADGWWLRSDIIWAKPNPMPESVTDRPTKAHEYVFLFSKSARYFWDAEAVREPQSNNTHLRHSKAVEAGDETVPPAKSGSKELERPGYEKWREYAPKTMLEGGRNLRSVWAIATHPYSGAHFATFPPALVEPMIKAASKPGDTVLDPFGGAGTAALVAERLGRDSIICELNAGYAEMARQRITDDAPMLVDVRLNS